MLPEKDSTESDKRKRTFTMPPLPQSSSLINSIVASYFVSNTEHKIFDNLTNTSISSTTGRSKTSPRNIF